MEGAFVMAHKGMVFETLFSNSLRVAQKCGLVVRRFWDKPKKNRFEGRDLLPDFWFVTLYGVFVSVELKKTKSKNRLPFSNISSHQVEDLKAISRAGNSKGWLLIWFKQDGRKANRVSRIFAINARFLEMYLKCYPQFKRYFGIENKNDKPKSIFLDDLNFASNYFFGRNVHAGAGVKELKFFETKHPFIQNKTVQVLKVGDLL